jgi:hypothetical protein
MKKIALVILIAVGVGLTAAPSSLMAAPASGNSISEAAANASPVNKAWCRWRRHCGPGGCWTRRWCW